VKKRIFLILSIALLSCASCSSTEKTTEESTEVLEGYEGLSDEEANQKMIREADKQEVVPDKKE